MLAAISMAWAMPCDDSKAGSIPSVLATRSNVSSASASRHSADAFGILPIAMLGTNAGIVESSGNRVDVGGLTVFVLHDVAETSVQHTSAVTVRQRGSVLARLGRESPPASTPTSLTSLSSIKG